MTVKVAPNRELPQTFQQLAHLPNHLAAQRHQLGALRLGLSEPLRGITGEEELSSTISDDEDMQVDDLHMEQGEGASALLFLSTSADSRAPPSAPCLHSPPAPGPSKTYRSSKRR